MSRAKNLANLIGGASAGTSGMALPSGTTAQRPSSATAGTIRNNTSSGLLEFYTGTEWKPVGSVYDNLTTSTGYFHLPSGTTAQRPASPTNGMMRYNSTTGFAEVYTTTGGWANFSAVPPNISTITPVNYNGESGTQFTINGTYFTSDATISFITNSGSEYAAASITFINSTQILATTSRDFTVAEEPLSVKIIQASGAFTKSGIIDCGGIPSWTTAAGTLATINDRYGNYSPIATVAATDPDANSTISYSITTGALPAGTSLNSSTGQITGDPTDVVAQTTSNFSIAATDNAGNQSVRAFNIIINLSTDGSSSSRAAPSGYWLAQNISGLSTGYYWIKSASMPNPLQMWVDMTEESGGYDFYAIQGTGTSVAYANVSHSGTALGLDIVYPRSKFHWRAMSNFVRNGSLAGSYSSYFQIAYGVHKTTGGGDYTGTIMRKASNYGSGSSDHRVNDNGRWWLRDSTFGEPNGDYTAYAWFGLQAGGYTFPNPYNLEDIGFNDGNASYSTGGYYLVSTNAKP